MFHCKVMSRSNTNASCQSKNSKVPRCSVWLPQDMILLLEGAVFQQDTTRSWWGTHLVRQQMCKHPLSFAFLLEFKAKTTRCASATFMDTVDRCVCFQLSHVNSCDRRFVVYWTLLTWQDNKWHYDRWTNYTGLMSVFRLCHFMSLLQNNSASLCHTTKVHSHYGRMNCGHEHKVLCLISFKGVTSLSTV